MNINSFYIYLSSNNYLNTANNKTKEKKKKILVFMKDINEQTNSVKITKTKHTYRKKEKKIYVQINLKY